jgi:GT2 family glycosyltransferase
VGYVGGDGSPDCELAVQSVGYASGAGVLYRTSALREVGLSDPELFMYHEDSDLSWRLRLAGWDILLAPRAIMHHQWEFDRSWTTKLYFIERNRLVNLLTHYRVRTLLLVTPALLLLEICSLAFAALHGWLVPRLAVYAYLLKPSTRRYLAAKRRSVQAIRRVPDRAVAAHLTGRIDAPFIEPRVLRLLNPLFAGYWRLVRPLIVW